MSAMFDITADGTRVLTVKQDRPRRTQVHLVLNPLSALADDSQPGPTRP